MRKSLANNITLANEIKPAKLLVIQELLFCLELFTVVGKYSINIEIEAASGIKSA